DLGFNGAVLWEHGMPHQGVQQRRLRTCFNGAVLWEHGMPGQIADFQLERFASMGPCFGSTECRRPRRRCMGRTRFKGAVLWEHGMPVASHADILAINASMGPCFGSTECIVARLIQAWRQPLQWGRALGARNA